MKIYFFRCCDYSCKFWRLWFESIGIDPINIIDQNLHYRCRPGQEPIGQTDPEPELTRPHLPDLPEQKFIIPTKDLPSYLPHKTNARIQPDGFCFVCYTDSSCTMDHGRGQCKIHPTRNEK